MLMYRCEAALLRVAVAILEASAPVLMAMGDLEDILTHLKLRVPGEPPGAAVGCC